MTNRELGKQASEAVRTASLLKDGMTDIDRALGILQRAADRLTELPDPTPPAKSDEDRMRELVEKHYSVGRYVRYDEEHGVWEIADAEGSYTSVWYRVTAGIAMSHIRGIVKAKCGPNGDWFPSSERPGKWRSIGNGGKAFDTELEAIDALLTAMEGQ